MDDEDDVRKLNDFVNSNKGVNIKLEFEKFINSDDEDEDDIIIEEEALDEDLIEEFDIDISKVNHQVPPNASLRTEERFIIDSCNDAELKNLLILNRQKNIDLILYYKKIKDLLLECKSNIAEKTDQLEKISKLPAIGLTGIWRIAAPYFKDKQNFPCRPNADCFRKKENNELNIYDIYVFSKWSQMECDKLIKAVKLNYSLNLQLELTRRNRSLQNKLVNSSESEAVLEEISEIESQLEILKDTEDTLCPPLKSDENINWDRISDLFLHNRHTPSECRSFWHIHLHPEINKSNWTSEENTKITKLAKLKKFQNWDKIAEELKTKRSGFSVCLHYMSHLLTKFKKEKFSQHEDEKLLKLVEQYRIGNIIQWSKVRQHFADRRRDQLYHRYTYYLNQEVRKDRFSPEEDVLLLILVHKFGRSFSKCAQYFPGRSSSQLKARFSTNLQGSIRKGSFTKEEDITIMEYVKNYGTKSWSGLTNTLNRARGQIRQRYLVLSKFFDGNPNGTFDEVIRRNHTAWEGEDGAFQCLQNVADMYQNKEIPTFDEIKEALGQHNKPKKTSTNASSKKPIDNMLVEFFCNSYKMKTAEKSVYSPALTELIDNVEETLTLLGANLEIPCQLTKYADLDDIDKLVLKSLAKRQKRDIAHPGNSKEIKELLPPNLNTVIGLRSLIIKYQCYKSKSGNNMFLEKLMPFFSHKKDKVRIETLVTELPPDDREKAIWERNLFYKRFLIMFKWASVLTLQPPSLSLTTSFYRFCSNNPQNNFVTPFQVAQYGRKRPRTYPSKRQVKKVILDNVEIDKSNAVCLTKENLNSFSKVCSGRNIEVVILNTANQVIESQPNVVIEDISDGIEHQIINAQPEAVSNGILEILDQCKPDNERQTIIKEANFTAITNEPSCSYNTEEIVENVSDSDDDLIDLKKLQGFLKKERLLKIEDDYEEI